jgi:hypothetical protein
LVEPTALDHIRPCSSEGKLYGVTYEGGTANLERSAHADGFVLQHSTLSCRPKVSALLPLTRLRTAPYGTTTEGGGAGLGTIFEIQTNGAGLP